MRKQLCARLAALICFGAAMIAAPALAQVNANEPDPSVWLKSVYDIYQRAEKDDKLLKEANYRLIVKRSSKTLSALFRKNDACEKKSEGICAIDWDFVVNGQDSQLSDVNVGQTVANGDKATVTATFRNMGQPNRNIYYFTRENGVWKVEDIESRAGSEKPTRIAAMLRNYKP